MGQSLSHPIESKHLLRRGNEHFRFGGAHMQGWRQGMEDAYTVVLSLPDHPNAAFFGLFDGHGGCESSRFLSQHLHQNINKLKNIHDRKELLDIILHTDKMLLNSIKSDDGSTAVFVIAEKVESSYILSVVNVGDSRIVLAKNGRTSIAMSHDHKPTKQCEKERIEKAGGYVANGRVGGALALSRAFGDRHFKVPVDLDPQVQQVISVPDIISEVAYSSDYLFLACDGIFENKIYSRQEVINYISDRMKHNDDLAQITSDLLDSCLCKGSTDNMSAMIVQFKDGTSYHQDEIEFIPGPYHYGNQHVLFQNAYMSDAMSAGYSVEEALRLRELNKKKKKESRSANSSPEVIKRKLREGGEKLFKKVKKEPPVAEEVEDTTKQNFDGEIENLSSDIEALNLESTTKYRKERSRSLSQLAQDISIDQTKSPKPQRKGKSNVHQRRISSDVAKASLASSVSSFLAKTKPVKVIKTNQTTCTVDTVQNDVPMLTISSAPPKIAIKEETYDRQSPPASPEKKSTRRSNKRGKARSVTVSSLKSRPNDFDTQTPPKEQSNETQPNQSQS